MKLTFEDKKEIYNLYCQGYGYKLIARIYHVNRTTIQRICRLAARHGLDVFLKDFTCHSEEFKLIAIERVVCSRESIVSVAIDLGLSAGLLCNWIKAYNRTGIMSLPRRKAGLQPVTKKKKTVEELEKENEELREQLLKRTIENELLKKLQALAYNYRRMRDQKRTTLI